jgi:serine/threonine protein kinase
MSSGAGHKTFGQIWADTAQFCVPIGAAATVILVAILGGTRLLEVGLAAGAVTVVVLTTVVAFLRLSRGAAGIPRGAIRCGDLVGGWLVLDVLRSALRPEGTFVARRGSEFGILKVTYHHETSGGEARRRAERESEYLGRVKSPHVVRVLDSSSSSAATYLVTAYLGEQTLWDRRQRGDVPDAELYSIAVGALRGLKALHDQGIEHRDLTPRNVMVDPHGGASVIDLGIAIADGTARLTKTRSQIFTVGYRAPEQFAGHSAPQSDVFVWAATIFYLATGTEAFPGDEAAAQGKITSQMPDLRGCPAWLRPVLSACFERDLDRRPSAEEALRALAQQNSQKWAVHEPHPSRPRRVWTTPSWVGPAALATALVLAPTTILLQSVDSESDSSTVAGPDSVVGTSDQQNGPTTPETTAVDDTGEPSGTSSSTTSTTSSPTTTSTTAAPTTTAPAPPGPIAAYLGVWHGDSVGQNGSVPVVFAIDNVEATAEGSPTGTWTYNQCSGPLRLVTVDDSQLVVTPVEPDPNNCGFGGTATLVRSGESASYDWTSGDGLSSRTGTFVRSSKVTLDNPGWPTGSDDAGTGFFANLGVCATGASGCSESGQFPDWTACTSNDLCIAGGGASVVDVWRGLTWVLEIPDSVSNTAVALLGVGFTEDQVIDLLGL